MDTIFQLFYGDCLGDSMENLFNFKVSDALIKKVLDQVDDGINFGESAQSPKGSPKLNRRPGALGQRLLPEEPSAMGRSRSGSTASQADE